MRNANMILAENFDGMLRRTWKEILKPECNGFDLTHLAQVRV
jgi:hypothetical protein